MERMFRAPGTYLQAPGLFQQIESILSPYGSRFFWITDEGGAKRNPPPLFPSKQIVFSDFLTEANAKKLAKECKELQIDAIIGVGGGKILDTAKATAHYANCPLIVIPTTASTDAPCSAISVLDKEDGTIDRYLHLRNNPDLVIVDSQIIANAPARLLAAGIGDGLSTWIEARTSSQMKTIAARVLAKECYHTLIRKGLHAFHSCEKNEVSQELEDVIEACILLSGIGFESGGLSLAHPLNNAFARSGQCVGKMHGEIVGFTTLVQLILEEAEELPEVFHLLSQLNFPLTLKELGFTNSSETLLTELVINAQNDNTYCYQNTFVTPEQIVKAIIDADTMGSSK